MGTKTVKITKKTAEKLAEIQDKLDSLRDKRKKLVAAQIKILNKIATKFDERCKETEEIIIPWPTDKEQPFRRVVVKDKRGETVFVHSPVNESVFIEASVTGRKKAK